MYVLIVPQVQALVNEAYDCLGNPQARALYDRELACQRYMKGRAAQFAELLQKKRDVKKAAEIPKVKTPKGCNDNQDVDANIEEVKFRSNKGWKVKERGCFRWFQVSQNHSVSQAYELAYAYSQLAPEWVASFESQELVKGMKDWAKDRGLKLVGAYGRTYSTWTCVHWWGLLLLLLPLLRLLLQLSVGVAAAMTASISEYVRIHARLAPKQI